MIPAPDSHRRNPDRTPQCDKWLLDPICREGQLLCFGWKWAYGANRSEAEQIANREALGTINVALTHDNPEGEIAAIIQIGQTAANSGYFHTVVGYLWFQSGKTQSR
jgi:hypothetical protein